MVLIQFVLRNVDFRFVAFHWGFRKLTGARLKRLGSELFHLSYPDKPVCINLLWLLYVLLLISYLELMRQNKFDYVLSLKFYNGPHLLRGGCFM